MTLTHPSGVMGLFLVYNIYIYMYRPKYMCTPQERKHPQARTIYNVYNDNTWYYALHIRVQGCGRRSSVRVSRASAAGEWLHEMTIVILIIIIIITTWGRWRIFVVREYCSHHPLHYNSIVCECVCVRCITTIHWRLLASVQWRAALACRLQDPHAVAQTMWKLLTRHRRPRRLSDQWLEPSDLTWDSIPTKR